MKVNSSIIMGQIKWDGAPGRAPNRLRAKLGFKHPLE